MVRFGVVLVISFALLLWGGCAHTMHIPRDEIRSELAKYFPVSIDQGPIRGKLLLDDAEVSLFEEQLVIHLFCTAHGTFFRVPFTRSIRLDLQGRFVVSKNSVYWEKERVSLVSHHEENPTGSIISSVINPIIDRAVENRYLLYTAETRRAQRYLTARTVKNIAVEREAVVVTLGRSEK
ncbi:hypothetical protein [Chitinivibrio alkaliphilus]|uniref:Lipoprotein n=1 Tax=Chitinivibrio alkaliphilus ACht1 TaxID=1313304 RepID=U7D6S6_9BACT|nr:hypothetical protein [Chitinivibrio alkaliphilus]ERP38665.1 hypothetical protein CALK_0681 [Chitinivibrio alkaliphilus ACht1]